MSEWVKIAGGCIITAAIMGGLGFNAWKSDLDGLEAIARLQAQKEVRIVGRKIRDLERQSEPLTEDELLDLEMYEKQLSLAQVIFRDYLED